MEDDDYDNDDDDDEYITFISANKWCHLHKWLYDYNIILEQ